MSPALPRGGLHFAAVFALCALFAVLAMGLTLLASGAYQDTVVVAEVNYTRRTALSYLVHQVRRSDADGCVYVESFGGGDALALVEPAAEKTAKTYSSWQAAYADYLRGWSGQADVWSTERGQLYQTMLADPAMAPLLDNSLFTTGVIGLPDYSET